MDSDNAVKTQRPYVTIYRIKAEKYSTNRHQPDHDDQHY